MNELDQGSTGASVDSNAQQAGAAGQGNIAPDVQASQSVVPEDLTTKVTKNDKGEVLVPLATVLDERRKRQALEGQVSAQEERLYLYRMNPMTPNTPAPQRQVSGVATESVKQEDVMDNMFKDVDDAEIVNVGDLKKALKAVAKTNEPDGRSNEATQEKVGEQLLMAVHSDAEQVITTGFRQRITNEPYLANYINGVHPMLRAFVAYRLGKGQTVRQAQAGAAQDAGAGKSNPNLQGQDLAKVIANANLPNPTALAAGSGSLSAADRYAAMSDAEFEVEINRVKSQG